MVYQLPSSFSGGIQSAVESIKKWTLPQSVTSPVVKPTQVKQTTKLPVKKAGYVPLTREQFMKAQESGFTPDQIIEMEKRRKAEMEWANPESWIGKTILPQSKEQAIARLKEWPKIYKDTMGGIISSIPSQLGNIAKFGTDVWNALLPWQPLAWLGQRAQQLGQKWQEAIQGAYGSRPDSNYTKVGEFAGEMAGGTLLGGWLVRWASMIPKVWAVAQKAPFLTKVAKWATEGLGFDVASQGEVGAGTAIGAGLPFVWATFNKAKELLTSTLPKSFIARWMATPSALKNASERLSRLADDGVLDIDKAPEWMLNKWLQGSKPQIQKQLTTIIKDSGKKKAEMLASGKPLSNVPQVQELQQGLAEVLTNFAKVSKKWEITPTAGNKEIVAEIVWFINNKAPTPVEFERARSLLGNMGIFTKGGALADSAQKEGLQKIWIQASKYLDDTFPWFREVNKDIEVANALGKAIWLKEAQDSVRNLLTFTNLGMGGLWATYWYSKEWNLWGALTYGAGALGARYILNNPAVLTRLAQWLSGKKLKTTLDAIQKAWRSKATIPILSKQFQNE